MTAVSICVFVIFLALAIVTDVLFVEHKRDGYYFLSGTFLFGYMLVQAVNTFFHVETIAQMLGGLALAIIPIAVWGLPLMMKLPWMANGSLRSSGDD